MAELIEQIINKLGLHDEPRIMGKSTELLRLLDLRSGNVSATLNVYAKSVLCIDLAAVLLGIPFDQENAIKLSGLRNVQYASNKRMFEKLLDLNKLVDVSDICIKLSVNELSKKAAELLELYKNTVDKEATDFDITHPQYAAMAVYQASKIAKKRISKQKIMAFSHLRPSQWSQLEYKWDKIIAANIEKNVKSSEPAQQDEVECPKYTKSSKKNSEAESYEVWKHRILAMAQLELSSLNDKTKFNKENVVMISP